MSFGGGCASTQVIETLFCETRDFKSLGARMLLFWAMTHFMEFGILELSSYKLACIVFMFMFKFKCNKCEWL